MALCFIGGMFCKLPARVSDVYLIRDGYSIVSPVSENKLIAFYLDNGKVGFAGRNSKMCMSVRPVFDELYNYGWLLLPVKKDGKWGVVDLALRYHVPDAKERGLIIPCVYKNLPIVKDDNIVVCDGKTIDIRNLGYKLMP